LSKKLIAFLVLLYVCLYSEAHTQVQPTLQLNAGLLIPGKDFAGDLVTMNESGDVYKRQSFIRNNYAASTGASVTGTLKFPFERSGTLNGLFTGSYSFFNAFRRSALGTTQQNNIIVPVTYDNRISMTTFALGVDATASAGSTVSPFISTSLSLNIYSLTLSTNGITNVIFNDAFRMGLLSNAGLQYRFNPEYSFILSGSYHMSNLFFKSQSGSYSDRIGFYRESIPINDEEGSFYSDLSNPNSEPVIVEGTTKNINWWSINLGLSIVLGLSLIHI
jgi:hypothetical protein